MIFQIVKKQIDAIDLFGLLENGCPDDEFDIESRLIANQITKGMKAYDIAKIIAKVMNRQFDEKYTASDFNNCARQIEKDLNKTEI